MGPRIPDIPAQAPRGWRPSPGRLALWLVALGMLVAAACTPQAARRYYSFTPAVVTTQAEATPLPMTVWFQSVDVGPTYNRTQIVYRYSEFELQYFANRLWADRPERMLQNVIFVSMSNARLFDTFQDRVSDKNPTHILTAHVDALEELVGQNSNYAHLALTLRLTTYETNNEVWRYRIDRTRPVPRDSTELMVRALSELLDQELERAIKDLRATMDGRPRRPGLEVMGPTQLTPRADDPDATVTLTSGELKALAEAGVEIPHDSEWMNSLQFNVDETVLPARTGGIFVPALSGDGGREPTVLLERVEEEAERGDDAAGASSQEEVNEYARGQTGKRIVVEPGLYHVYIGSGTIGQRLMKEVMVLEDRVTVVEPFWSALDVQVLDDRFVPVRESYELFGMRQQPGSGAGADDAYATGSGVDQAGYYGTGFGADAELGEETRVWLVPNGLYKLVQLGGNYRARTNFATVYLLEGELTRFNLVIDPESGNFLGAGVAQQTTEDDPETKDSGDAWTLSLSLGGDLLLAYSSAAVGQQQGTSLTATLFTDGLFQYNVGPHRWITRAEIEESQNRNQDGGFRTRADRLYAHSIYIYQLWDRFGPYVRAGAETAMLPRAYYLDEPQDVTVLDPTGEAVETLEEQLRFQLAPGFSPLDLREGAGVNFQVIRTVPLEVSARLGLGSRQFVVRDPGYVLTPITDRDGELEAVQQVFGNRLGGVELTLLATARLTRYVQLRSELDALVPVRLFNTYLQWRTIASLRLSSFASLNYRLELTRDTNQSLDQPLAFTNILQLQFFYKPL